ncbi:NAD-dependent epimerase/dehydratase family protein [Paenibacillus mendelii]|uniref:NAD-dependent epimerase/dehydratase family protein n=1 Tax=Paenibacillus mendelii TaxID=206163 RepID=A0ABV6J3C8_9BACL|nr:NAD(P)-dependent oxidoreductase [Paenibacillus mendelii]MCQ6563574.1 NAD(P)-dependent oxidoreductase [Paenibacillus mendelii]
MNRVMVTGASGFLGRHVLQALHEHGYEVHAVSRLPKAAPDTDLNWHQADLFNVNQVSDLMEAVRPSHCLHLAWEATPGVYWNSYENFRWVEATAALTRLFQAYGGKRFVAAGTCAEYVWQEDKLKENETPLSFHSPYAACKNDAYLLTSRFAKFTDLSMAWCRLFFLYGPYESSSRLVPSVIRSLHSGSMANCSEGTQKRDYLYVEDAAEAMVAVLDSDINGPVNIASGLAVPVKDLVGQIAALMNQPHLIQLGAAGSASKEEPLVLADIERLRSLRWQPKHNLEQGLSKTIRWWNEFLRGEM